MASEFMLERKLKEEDPALHKNAQNCLFVLPTTLQSFFDRFLRFTDHTILHSLEVLDYSNRLIGEEQIRKLSAVECYVLIMACYLHDVGMGISDKDLKEFSEKIDFGNFFDKNDREDEANTIRAFHHDYSGLFIRKYAAFFEIPAEELIFSIIQVARGHRKTDLFDEKEYPDLPYGNGVIRTAYLAAVLRLADEIDVAVDRNPEILFDTSTLTEKGSIEAFGTHESIRRVDVTKDSIILNIRPKAPEYVVLIDELAGKIRKTLDYCRKTAELRSDLRITQTALLIRDV